MATSKPIYLQKKRIATYIYIKVLTTRGKQKKRYRTDSDSDLKEYVPPKNRIKRAEMNLKHIWQSGDTKAKS